MCGRYFIATDNEESEIKKIIEQVNDQYKNSTELSEMKVGEIYPTDIVPVITAESPVLMKWGFTRFDGKGQIINARLETASEKPMFREPFFGHRCLIPATHYFEWEKHGAIKLKYSIGLEETLYMAALFRFERDITMPRFVILTRPAAPKISFIHERMPVILAKDMHEAWLYQCMNDQHVMNNSVENLIYHGENFQPVLF